MDAKVELMDKILFQPLIELLEELDLYDTTTIVAVSDHGTNIGEHPAPLIPHLEITHPQHVFLYTEDLHVPLIIKSSKLPKGRRIPGLVRAIDIVPTVLDLLSLDVPFFFDGVSLVPFVQQGEARGLVNYSEELWEERGPGDLQGLRNDRYNYVVDRRNDNNEEFYDLENDPGEQINLIDILSEEEQLVAKQMREQADFYYGAGERRAGLDKEEEEKIRSRLRDLHYIP
jgi:arylsulfatase A-like enzyme